ncbi:hypothetical protein NG829_08345 [Xanthomonas sacchari]|uniref:Uncharacterized protein n=1 Tax=Xanthomonas sacchari TaxID=56458 RepID=A0ABT3DTC4_9XANT|nr:hypothetical protein [Xanthomonas sacchari]MCW0398745.1 hypothetical protein [Xanthomonas sacchari]MCW0418393.1 hypothetical protein [Xanthomonas sacchari]UYK72545.1 hypothetical protein NG828_20550 [Xanthomonas sacchari]UYK82285.1 hypothetical protein NG829_08345 [Xanthomonas sacchari]
MSAAAEMQHFPTGHGKQTLCILIGIDHVWAGLYTTRERITPAAIGVSTSLNTLRYRDHQLHVGQTQFRMTATAVRRAAHWLRYRGIGIRELP